MVFHLVEGGQEDDGGLPGVGESAQALADVEAGEVWHHDVQQDQIGILARGDRNSLHAACRGNDLVPCAREQSAKQSEVRFRVVDDQDFSA